MFFYLRICKIKYNYAIIIGIYYNQGGIFMKRSTKLITSTMLATAVVSSNIAFATTNVLENEKNININIDKTT